MGNSDTQNLQATDGARSLEPLVMSPFCGTHSDEYNAMRSALRIAARDSGHSGEYMEYDYLAEIPRTSLSVDLVEALHKMGYAVRRHNVGSEPFSPAKSDVNGGKK